MNKTKRIIIASLISLVVVSIFSYVIKTKENNSFVKVPIALKEIKIGEKINNTNTKWINVKKDIEINNIYKNLISVDELKKYVASKEVTRGQVINKSNLVLNEEYLANEKGYQYIALPISSSDNGVSYKIKKGDNITVYYTAKRRNVEAVLKEKLKMYSTENMDGMVTCKLYENIQVISVNNSIGQEVEDNTITDIVIRLSEQDAMLLANLKEQGTFTLAIN